MAPTPRDLQRLQGVHPTLVTAVLTLLNEFPMFVAQGVRTVDQQQALYAQGRTAPGHIVTNADGILKRSNHQPHADGLGHAVDLAWTGTDPFGDSQPWPAFGAQVEALGLVWGGSWHSSLVDRPHIELPASV